MNIEHNELFECDHDRLAAAARATYSSRLKDLAALMEADARGQQHQELGPLAQYGLCFDYIPPGTFRNRRGYYRYQLSTGGPGDEFDFTIHQGKVTVQYRYLDWYTKYTIWPRGKSLTLLLALWEQWLADIAPDAFDKAIEYYD